MRELADVLVRLADLERRVANTLRHGTVHEVDPAGGTVRLRIGGTDAAPVLSPAVPYSQLAGALSVHAPPSVGQQMTLVAPPGDHRQAVAMPMTWSDANPSPGSDGETNVVAFGGVRIEVAGEGIVISVGGVSVSISGAGFAVIGGDVTHNGTSVGDGHAHTAVMPGPGISGPPV